MKKFLLFFACCIICLTVVCAQAPDISVLNTKAPETFKALFKTTRGEFVIEVYRNWSLHGADRLYQLITSGFFNDALFFRVEPDFVVQFGVSPAYAVNRFWDPRKIPDDPVMVKNKKGTISFARAGRNNRATQIFINMADNVKLDTTMRDGLKGYAPVARVIKGMDVVARFNARYGKKPAGMQDSLYKYGNGYFEKQFPGLDKILRVTIIK